VSLPFYPPAAFCFDLSFDGSGADASFQEISGLKVEWTSEEVEEGGQNRFVHKLPLRVRHSNLVLKRGVALQQSPLSAWLKTSFRGSFVAQPAQTKNVVVKLLDGRKRPLVKWSLTGAYPVSWDHSPLNSTESSLLVETMELSCRFFERETYS
jgi:phage tail-like protein